MDYFTSDLHFGHKNIIEYCNRPFSSVEDMTLGLTENWNRRVSPQDTVYVLGDFAMGPKDKWPGYRAALNGRIILIRGNHDAPIEKVKAFLLQDDEIHDQLVYVSGSVRVHMAHYPNISVFDDHRGYMRTDSDEVGCTHKFCGHVHSHFVEKNGYINVGVDVRNYEPKLLSELIK